MFVAAAIAGGVAGLALWCTAGSLDRVDGMSGPIRVAMLPPLWLGAALVLAGAALALGGVSALSRASTGRWRPVDRADADVFLPLLATVVLVLPFVPWLADWLPAWIVLAGPFVRLVWFVVGALVVRAALLRVWSARHLHITIFPAAATAMILTASALMYGAAAAKLAGTALFPGGDEPHYLVIAQSLWRDHDFKIENNHQRGDTFEYFARPLRPHYLTRGVDGEIYSVHPVGLPLLVAPIYALGGYALVVLFLVLVAAAAATVAWRLASGIVDGHSATFGWLAGAMTAPWVFNSFTVYPEVPAALCVVLAFSLALRLGNVSKRGPLVGRLAICGLAVALLPWLSSKYAAMGAALSAVVLLRLWLPGSSRWLVGPGGTYSVKDRVSASVAFAVPCAISAVALLTFFWTFWGKPSPSAPYGGMNSMDLSFLAAGGLGLLFDQEYGIVAVAPVLGLALIGLVGMLRGSVSERRVAVEIILVFGALLVTVGAFRLWWGGSASAGRPVISGLLLLVLPCAWQLKAWAHNPALRASAWTLLFTSLAISAMFGWAQQGLLLITEKDGSSRLLAWWSPAWSLTSLSPTFIEQSPLTAGLVAAVWLVLGAIALLALRAMPRGWRAGAASLAVALVAFVTLSGVALAVPSWTTEPSTASLSARPFSPFLDEFDARWRPLSFVYDPIRRIAPAEAPHMVRLVSRAGQARALSVSSLLNQARWALPAGDYDVDIWSSDGLLPQGGQVALQVGRGGPSFATWTLTEASERWRVSFSLPIDVNFVGFKASQNVAAMKPSIAIHARAVRDRSSRLPALDVLHSRRYDRQVVLFHDTNVNAEPNGFWTLRDSSTRITVKAPDATHATLRLHAGPVATTIVVRANRQATTLTLQPREPRELPLPETGSPVRVEISTHGGFVPAEVDPASRDARGLGCWIEVVDGS
jgi:hypothetical protein